MKRSFEWAHSLRKGDVPLSSRRNPSNRPSRLPLDLSLSLSHFCSFSFILARNCPFSPCIRLALRALSHTSRPFLSFNIAAARSFPSLHYNVALMLQNARDFTAACSISCGFCQPACERGDCSSQPFLRIYPQETRVCIFLEKKSSTAANEDTSSISIIEKKDSVKISTQDPNCN